MNRIDLEHSHHYDKSTATLHCCSNGGLFSNFYHTYWSLVDLKNQGITPQSISFSSGFGLFRGSSENLDLYPSYFCSNTNSIDQWEKFDVKNTLFPRLDHHGIYATYPYQNTDLIMKSYFRPSSEIVSLVNQFKKKYALERDSFHGFYYRGTDKGTEVDLPDIDTMLDQVEIAIQNSDVKKLLIQTDQAEVLARALKRFPNALYLEELPVISGDQGFHYENERKEIIEPKLFSMRLLAMTTLLAEARSLVLPTSNLAGWICLIRGNTKGVAQFDKHGKQATQLTSFFYNVKNKLRLLRAKALKKAVVYI